MFVNYLNLKYLSYVKKKCSILKNLLDYFVWVKVGFLFYYFLHSQYVDVHNLPVNFHLKLIKTKVYLLCTKKKYVIYNFILHQQKPN